MPQRVSEGREKIKDIGTIGGPVLGFLSIAPKHIGFAVSLNLLNSVLICVAIFFLWMLHKDLDSMDNNSVTDQDQEMKEADNLEPQTDGGIYLSPELRELQEESPEGGGALAGLVAGGSLGMVGGPVGVVLGGLVGGLVGNEAEYQQIVSKYQDALGETAKSALRSESKARAPEPYSIENIDHQSSDGTYAVTILDGNGNKNIIRLNLESQEYYYEQ